MHEQFEHYKLFIQQDEFVEFLYTQLITCFVHEEEPNGNHSSWKVSGDKFELIYYRVNVLTIGRLKAGITAGDVLATNRNRPC